MANFTVSDTPLDGVKLIETRRFADERGWFSETWSAPALAAQGVTTAFVQDNQSLSVAAGTLRGVHFQHHPTAQDKLVRVLSGRIWDVAVDLRRGSPTFGHWHGVELGAEDGRQLLVPVGFGHGFVTLEPNAVVAYKVSAPYSAADDAGVAWDDPDLAIDWPLPPGGPVLSAKDRALPRVADARLFD